MIIYSENYKTIPLGSKARNLFLLLGAGFSVPPFFCVDKDFAEGEVLSHLAENFPDAGAFSVRSCASLEDSAGHSFAGQFKTFLRVPAKDVCMRIREVFSDAERPETSSYCLAHHLDPAAPTMHVIVQEMVEPELSGVLFTANPQGLLNESVIVCGSGSGDQVVEDKTDATTYYYNLTDKTCYYEQTGLSPLLTAAQVDELISLSGQIKTLLHEECDIEFAVRDKKIYFLQARPITSIDKDAPVIILDNSNIVESYPGITLPLTQSFIREAYYQVFRNLMLRLTREPETVEKIDDTLQHMVDAANGRIYYRISNWYDVLLFLPFHRRLIPIWQEMMGVKNRTVNSAVDGKIRRTTRLKTTCSFFRLLLTCPAQMKRLEQEFQDIIRHFGSLDTDGADNRTLLKFYRQLLDQTVEKWDITLVNDMYCFLFTGLLKARLRAKHVPDCELAANRAISNIWKLESMRPIEALQKLAAEAKDEQTAAELKKIDSNEAYYQYIKDNDNAFSLALQDYIREFGDRNVEELKLESKTFRTDPVLLVRCILRYAETASVNNADSDAVSANSPVSVTASHENAALHHTDTAATAFSRDAVPPSAPLPLTGLSAFFARRAAVGIRNREKSRLYRGRLYGMMRSLALQMGENLYTENRIAQPNDIFWLYIDEIEAAGADLSLNLRHLISARKIQYDGFSALPAFSRLIFSGKVTDKAPKKSRKMQCRQSGGTYFGTPCSPGCAEGEALVIEQPSPGIDTKDKILIAKMTDPGWVFLIARAKAIVSEKGSLLSHTAIISRELGKPSVVGVEHITEYIKTGDTVRVDGDTGVIIKIMGR